jgi:Tfp pilus assembly protein PilF
LLGALAACGRGDRLPSKSSNEYNEALRAFFVGLAALQVGDDIRADAKLAELTRLAPGEPAGWVNWGVLALRQRNFDAAKERFTRALELTPQDARIYNLLGLLESSRGNSAQSIAYLQKAMEQNPRDLRNIYALAQEIEREGASGNEARVQELIEKIVAVKPENLAAQLELARVATKRGDAAALKSAIERIGVHSSAWPSAAQQQFAMLHAAAAAGDFRTAGTAATLLRNVLAQDPSFARNRVEIKALAGEELQPYTHLAKLESPPAKASPADVAIAFDSAPIPDFDQGRWEWIGGIQLGSAGAPIVGVANGREFRMSNGATLPFPGGRAEIGPGPDGVLQADFNYDFKTDLVFAGAGGLRFFAQQSPNSFADATAATKLPQALIDAPYTGAWAVDIEADGDLDIVLGNPQGVPTVLQNNGDGTFFAIHPFAGISGISQFAWADLDGDGVPDAAMLDGSGRLHVFVNERQGVFRERSLPSTLGNVKAIAVSDVDNDGMLDLVALQADGAIVRVSRSRGSGSFEIASLTGVPNPADRLSGEVRLRVADIDNNGSPDLLLLPVATGTSPAGPLAAGALVWLGDENGRWTLLDRPLGPERVLDIADASSNGRLDLLGLSAAGQPIEGKNRGSRNYHWQIVRPHAAQAFGDQRINPFGIGGEIEVRSGLSVQKQPITGPRVHFGLGEATKTDIVRVIWPNGATRAEFDVKADQEIETEQRLKGSCPFLFAFNGKEIAFVKDAVPWGSAIGLRINTLGSASIAATEEWYKIGRDELVPHDGYYDLRFTAELWEVYYYDYLSLLTVDHPLGTEIFVDERFVIPPAKLAITAVATPQKIARATDDTGKDVTELLRAVDGRAVDSFGHGQYQGVTRDHFVEIDLGDDIPPSGPLYLIAHGSIYPTDSSINVAMTQGERWRARGLSLEVPDGRGGWRVANDNLGFPAGRKKIMLIDLTGLFARGVPHRVRLRTNLEIYWDKIEWARGLPETALRIRRLEPTTSDLHYRGYSVIERPSAGAPETPDYNRLSGSKQRWRDLIGYYTRYGDVRELLARVDDRYVIMNSGDEMSLRFAEEPPPAPGLVRDFVIVGDGWIKDGDYNSTFSKTVQPLPYHAEREYTTPPGALEDEWVYRQHPEDWQNYHTRYVTPEVFRNALRVEATP